LGTGDFEKFIRIIRENEGQVSSVYCFSPGGDFYEAMKIGRAMRALELSSHVPVRDPSGRPACYRFPIFPVPRDLRNCTCASAGFFIHVGGVHRAGTFLAVHRPYFEKGRFGTLPLPEAKKAFDALQEDARQYMNEMGVPKHIQEDVLRTASNQVLVLDEKTVNTRFLGALPYIYEWTKNKCEGVAGTEQRRNENYIPQKQLADQYQNDELRREISIGSRFPSFQMSL
jgi:hypothetical protein